MCSMSLTSVQLKLVHSESTIHLYKGYIVLVFSPVVQNNGGNVIEGGPIALQGGSTVIIL